MPSNIVDRWQRNFDRKKNGGRDLPYYADMSQYRDLELKYGEGFQPDGYFVVYSLMDRRRLPDNLKRTTREEAESAALYYGSGQYDRGLDSIAEGLGIGGERVNPVSYLFNII